MKKGGARVSGILTMLLSLLVFLCSMLFLGKVFAIEFLQNLLENQTIAIIYMVYEAIFVMPFSAIFGNTFGMDFALVQKIMVFFNLAFYALGIFWGIKEITLAKKPDEKYAKCHHTCAFALVMKILTVVYFLYVFAASFYDQTFVATFNSVDIYISFIPRFTSTLSAVLAVYTLTTYLIPQISFIKAKNKFQADKDYEDFMSEQGNVPVQPDDQAQYADSNYVQDGQFSNANDQQYADMPQQYDQNGEYYPNVQDGQTGAWEQNVQYDPNAQYGYNPQGINVQTQYAQNTVEPLNPQTFTQNPNRSGVSIIPGQNGVPFNITPKGIESLARLERLRASGAIDEQNYFAMRKKVCQINVSSN